MRSPSLLLSVLLSLTAFACAEEIILNEFGNNASAGYLVDNSVPYDGIGDASDSIPKDYLFVGNTFPPNDESGQRRKLLQRTLLVFKLPERLVAGDLERATLRLFLDNLQAGSGLANVSVFHNGERRSFRVTADDFHDEEFQKTGIDLVVLGENSGEWVEADVTALIRDDLDKNPHPVHSSFRLQMDEDVETFPNSAPSRYRFGGPLMEESKPMLVLKTKK